MSKKNIKIVILCIILAVMMMSMSACTFNYGSPDKLEIGKISVWERISIGLQVALIGVVMVFVVLFLLILFIRGIELLTKKLEQVSKNKKEKALMSNSTEPTTQDIQVSKNQEDEEIIAVIMSALNMYYDTQNETSNLKFRVRSIKEIK